MTNQDLKMSMNTNFKYATQYAKEVHSNSYSKEFPLNTNPFMVKAERSLGEATVLFETVFTAIHSDNMNKAEAEFYMNAIKIHLERSKTNAKKYITLYNEEKIKVKEMSDEEKKSYVSKLDIYENLLNYREEFNSLKEEVEEFEAFLDSLV